MSFFSSLLGKPRGGGTSASADPEAPKRTLKQLDEMIRLTNVRIENLEGKCEKEKAAAKVALRAGNKRKAMLHAKRRLGHEKVIGCLFRTLSSFEEQQQAIQDARFNSEVATVMKSSASTLKSLSGTVSVEEVDGASDDLKEQMQEAEKLNDAVSRPINGIYDEEDEDILAFIDEMQDEILEEDTAEVEQMLLQPQAAAQPKPQPEPQPQAAAQPEPQPVPPMPPVPTHQPGDDDGHDEAELLALVQDMAQ